MTATALAKALGCCRDEDEEGKKKNKNPTLNGFSSSECQHRVRGAGQCPLEYKTPPKSAIKDEPQMPTGVLWAARRQAPLDF